MRVALTFDDGPDPQTTPLLLAALAASSAQATFMLWGEHAARYPDLVQQITAAGHALGNHTYTHQSLVGLSATTIQAELAATDAVIQKAVGVTPCFFRPPYGDIDAASLQAAARPAVTWRVDSEDWRTHDAEATYQRVLALVQPDDIVLMHDGLPSTATVLPRLLEALAKHGYEFETVPALFAGPMHSGHVYRARQVVDSLE